MEKIRITFNFNSDHKFLFCMFIIVLTKDVFKKVTSSTPLLYQSTSKFLPVKEISVNGETGPNVPMIY